MDIKTYVSIIFSLNKSVILKINTFDIEKNCNYPSIRHTAPPSVKIFTSFLSDKHKQTSFLPFFPFPQVTWVRLNMIEGGRCGRDVQALF